jgi:hypothetical protein
LSDLEARVKALEDWQQALAHTFLAPPTPTPQPNKSPAQMANENTTKEGTKCPECGGVKKPGYMQCWSCNEKKKVAK